MIRIIIAMLIFFSFMQCTASSHKIVASNTNNKVANEIAYLFACIKSTKNVDSLIQWELSSDDHNSIIFNHKYRWVFFELIRSPQGGLVTSIVYSHGSFQTSIDVRESAANTIEFTNETRFGVWMSRDRLNIYCCLIDSEKVSFWLIKNGNEVSFFQRTLD